MVTTQFAPGAMVPLAIAKPWLALTALTVAPPQAALALTLLTASVPAPLPDTLMLFCVNATPVRVVVGLALRKVAVSVACWPWRTLVGEKLVATCSAEATVRLALALPEALSPRALKNWLVPLMVLVSTWL